MQIISSGESSYLRKILCLKSGVGGGGQSVLGTNLNEPIRQMLVKLCFFVCSNIVEYGYGFAVDTKSKYCDPSQLCSVPKMT